MSPVPPSQRSIPVHAWTARCALYRLPVYALLRRSGHAPPAATSLARGFFAQLQSDLSRDPSPPEAGFRDYLRRRLVHFLAAPQIAADAIADADAALEDRYRDHFGPDFDADQCFERALGLELMATALAELRREALQGGRLDLLDALLPWLTQDPPAGQYAVIARTQRVSSLALYTALRRLRQRFRELVDSAMMQAVSGDNDAQPQRSALQHSFKSD